MLTKSAIEHGAVEPGSNCAHHTCVHDVCVNTHKCKHICHLFGILDGGVEVHVPKTEASGSFITDSNHI